MTETAPADPSPFTRVGPRRRGYDPEAVDAFLASARATFHGMDRTTTSDDVRAASFPMVRDGYAVRAVDSALARLEDAFAQQERADAIEAAGAERWVGRAREEAQELLARLTRPPKHRFERVGWMHKGYAVDEVDAVSARLARFFAEGAPVSIEQVRHAAFHPQRRGYREDQVDAVLDAVVRVMLAVR
ncbi:DivIVA domain-containing protein [Microbacterium sp. gxy059]|uniref:DivIVA domain-containing protein n=1 Tax=Microbacterium sp. gxy059 TaxID=2957199 RepID=UPI003D95672B